MAEQTSRLAVIIDSSGAQKNTDSLASSLAKLTQAGQKAADGAGKVTKATHDESQALSQLLDRIDPVNAALNKLDQQQQQLAKFKAKGFLDTDTFDAYSKKIDDARSRLGQMSEQLVKTGQSSKQAAFAMRMIPAQMTDIVVGLSTGQSPFMVLMQQGGQLKDMFGGIGPAIRGVGGYVMGLVNPFTLGAAAVGALGLAYYQGQQEQEAFQQSLILTGNQVGKTAGQLSDMAKNVSLATGSTQGAAADVLNQLVSAGNIAGDSLQKVAGSIVNMSSVTGQATTQMVSDFESIAENPVQAISKLNDQYHFLTLATYNQIKALADEGNQQDAARVATDAYANAINSRAKDIGENLNVLGKTWNWLGNQAKSAWDAMEGIGREGSIQDRIAIVQKQITDIQSNSKPGAFGLGAVGDGGYQDKRLTALKAQLVYLQNQATTEDVLTEALNKHDQQEQKNIKTQQDADKFAEQYMTNQQRRTKELNRLSQLRGSYSKQEYDTLVQQVNDRYKDPSQPKERKGRQPKAYTEDAGTRLIDQINQQTSALTTQLNTTDKLSSVTQQRIKFEQQIADIQARVAKNLPVTNDQQSLLDNQKKIEQAYKTQETLQNQVTTLDDYRKMMIDISSKEIKQNDTLQKRLTILQKMVDLKRLSPEDAAKQASDLISKSALPDSVISGVNSAGGTLKSGSTNSDLSGQGMNMVGLQSNPQLETLNKLRQAQMDYATWLNDQEKAINQSSVLNEQQRQTQLLALHQAGMQNQQTISTATYAAEMQSAQNSFSSITDSMGIMFGQQSAAYKAAFVTQKAFAIAQASLQLPMAMGQALAGLPFPANLAAIAQVVALMGTITSSITSVAATGFQSGGYTGHGGVSAPAGIVHGQEFVMDAGATRRIGVSNLEAIRKNGLDATLSRSGFGTGAKNVNNTINSQPNIAIHAAPITIQGNPDDRTIALIQASQKQAISQSYKMISGDLAAGKGQVHKSLVSGYNTSRRTG